MSLTQHPLSKLFPPMADDEYHQLVEDIRQHGVLQPIELLDGMVLDGWHRYSACEEIGIMCPTQTWSASNGETDTAAFQHVWARNMVRRHLTAGQRLHVLALAHPADWEEVGAQRGVVRQDHDLVPAATRLAAMAGVHADTVRTAKQVEREAPDLWERTVSGELSLTAANGIRLGRRVDQGQQQRKNHKQQKEMEWRTHFVKEVIEKIDGIQKIGDEIRTGLTHERFAPEAKEFVARRVDRAVSWLVTAREELRR